MVEAETYDVNTKEFKTRITESYKILHNAKLLIRRDYNDLLKKNQKNIAWDFEYKIRLIERG